MSAVQGAPPSLPEPTPPALSVPTRKRKAKTEGDGEAAGPEPRRLRRSHEACARCRSKKIKCDSKHPKCSACTNAGTPCHQEDRHRQTLTPRGHTEALERRLAQCEILLKRHIEGFSIDNIEEFMAREGLDPDTVPQAPPGFAPYGNPGPNGAIPHPAYGPVNGLPPYPPPPGVYGVPPPNGPPYPPVYVPAHIHPAFQHQNIAPQLQQAMSPPAQHTPTSPSASGPVMHDIRGQDPKSNDMSTTTALAKNFGVSAAIVNEIKLGPNAMDKEDLAVGALHSGRDRDIATDFNPRQPNHWVPVSLRRGSAPSSSPTQEQVSSPYVWLPRDRAMVDKIVDIYFTRLNIHRPVFSRSWFKTNLDALYAGTSVHDPGFILSVYMVLALGTLSEMSHRACDRDMSDGKVQDIKQSARAARNLMPENWPEHEEFFERALAVKPDLRVTVSSLQALIFLQWYLYTERQGRSLWRLVGSMVRLAVELGLHHDPCVQRKTFTQEECDLRVRLWAIVMVHDRGTSLLLGRPLAIAREDSNTPHPKRNCPDYSDHFAVSAPIADIQADIIISLYGPNKQTPDAIWRQATRIIKSISECQTSLPPEYQRIFCGTERWSPEDRRKQEINPDLGLTMLKIGIARILLLRALFSSKELSFERRSKALDDAIVTSHNIIIVHNELIRFPDIAFFVSPIPLHIAAMVILYGHMSNCKVLTRQQALEDVWMALDMLPRFRWRWERKDYNGEHPLIAKLAEKVFEAPLHQAGPTGCPILMPEVDWSADSDGPITPESPAMPTPTSSTANPSNPSNAPPAYSVPQPPSYNHRRPQVKGQEGNLAEVPPHWFYPLATELAPVPPGQHPNSAPGPSHTATSSYAPLGTIGCAPSQDSYVQEEKDAPVPPNQMEMWVNMVGSSLAGLLGQEALAQQISHHTGQE